MPALLDSTSVMDVGVTTGRAQPLDRAARLELRGTSMLLPCRPTMSGFAVRPHPPETET
jgi:hypothetical protein